MQNVAIASEMSAVSGDAGLRTQIAEIRESLRNHRERARKMWDACGSGADEETGEARIALGRFTEKLLKGQMNEAYG